MLLLFLVFCFFSYLCTLVFIVENPPFLLSFCIYSHVLLQNRALQVIYLCVCAFWVFYDCVAKFFYFISLFKIILSKKFGSLFFSIS